jgi:hypothetical protein
VGCQALLLEKVGVFGVYLLLDSPPTRLCSHREAFRSNFCLLMNWSASSESLLSSAEPSQECNSSEGALGIQQLVEIMLYRGIRIFVVGKGFFEKIHYMAILSRLSCTFGLSCDVHCELL